MNVPHVAKLANLSINDEEVNTFETQLSDVLTYVEKLNQINTDGTEPTSQVTGLENVLSEDLSADSLSQDVALSQAPKSHDHQFQVKGVFEE